MGEILLPFSGGSLSGGPVTFHTLLQRNSRPPAREHLGDLRLMRGRQMTVNMPECALKQ
jgi:hypothetical protein